MDSTSRKSSEFDPRGRGGARKPTTPFLSARGSSLRYQSGGSRSFVDQDGGVSRGTRGVLVGEGLEVEPDRCAPLVQAGRAQVSLVGVAASTRNVLLPSISFVIVVVVEELSESIFNTLSTK